MTRPSSAAASSDTSTRSTSAANASRQYATGRCSVCIRSIACGSKSPPLRNGTAPNARENRERSSQRRLSVPKKSGCRRWRAGSRRAMRHRSNASARNRGLPSSHPSASTKRRKRRRVICASAHACRSSTETLAGSSATARSSKSWSSRKVRRPAASTSSASAQAIACSRGVGRTTRAACASRRNRQRLAIAGGSHGENYRWYRRGGEPAAVGHVMAEYDAEVTLAREAPGAANGFGRGVGGAPDRQSGERAQLWQRFAARGWRRRREQLAAEVKQESGDVVCGWGERRDRNHARSLDPFPFILGRVRMAGGTQSRGEFQCVSITLVSL